LSETNKRPLEPQGGSLCDYQSKGSVRLISDLSRDPASLWWRKKRRQGQKK